jgi:hypothetical protein
MKTRTHMKSSIPLTLFLGLLLAGSSKAESETLATNQPSGATAPAQESAAVKQEAAMPPVATDPTPPPTATADMDAASALAIHLVEWKLAPDDIRSELQTTGRVVRSRTIGADEPTGPMDDIVIDSVQGTLQDHLDLAALRIKVEASKGVVTLSGTAQSLGQIGEAVALTLETKGVSKTISQIKLAGSP